MSKTSRLSSEPSCRVDFCRIGLIHSRIIHYFSDQWIDFYIHSRINSLWVTTILIWLCKYFIVTDGSLRGSTISRIFPLPINLWVYSSVRQETYCLLWSSPKNPTPGDRNYEQNISRHFIAHFKLRSSNYKVCVLVWLRSPTFK